MKMFNPYHWGLALGLGVAVLGTVFLASTKNEEGISFAQNAPGGILNILSKQYVLENPDLAINKKGDVVVVWQERKSQDYDVFVMKGQLDSLTFGAPVQVNSYKQGNQSRPRVAMNEKGNFVVVWESAGQDRSGSGVYGQRFTASLKKNRVEFQVHKTTADNQGSPDVVMNAAGAVTVVWASETANNKNKRIYMQRFDEKGARVGIETKVDKASLSEGVTFTNPKIAISSAEDMLVTWESVKGTTVSSIRAQVVDASGTLKTASDIVVSTATEDKESNPNVIPFGENQFLITWEKDMKSKEFRNLELWSENIKGRLIKNTGETGGDEIDITTANFNSNNTPEVVATGNGAVVIWQERKNTGTKSAEKNQWFMQAQELDQTGKPTGEAMVLISGRENPYNGTRVGSNTSEKVGILWGETEKGKAKSMIQFRPWTLQITAEEGEGVHSAAEEQPTQ